MCEYHIKDEKDVQNACNYFLSINSSRILIKDENVNVLFESKIRIAYECE